MQNTDTSSTRRTDPASQLIDQRLTELEIKASFSEDLLDELNLVIVRQQQQIDTLTRQLADLRLQLPEAGASAFGRASDELPPHY
ncbi:MAG: SlyX family protein [Polaromonas sp.]